MLSLDATYPAVLCNRLWFIKLQITLSLFKVHIYKSRERGTLELGRLINKIKKVKVLEINSAQNNERKLKQNNINWEKTHRTIKI